MFQYHPALVKALQQDRYYRLVNERRRCTTSERPVRPAPPARADVQVEPILNGLRAALANQAALAGGDPAVDAAVTSLIDALGPALQVAVFELAQQAAAELDAQLSDRTVEVVVADGDPALRVTELAAPKSKIPSEEFDARITLRLPPSLKNLIEHSATLDGDSVNAWVVDALAKRAKQSPDRGRHMTDSFDL